MNHQKLYESIIEKAKSENRKKYSGIYYEKHHILPKCINGTDDKENLVLLTAKEHFIAHKLLTYIYLGNRGINFAHYAMVNFPSIYRKNKLKLSGKDYVYAKKLFLEVCKTRKVWNKGTRGLYKHSLETLSKLSVKSAGKNNGMYGKTQTNETKKKIGKANSGENNGMKKLVKNNPNIIKGENNHLSKTYKIITPENKILLIKGLRNFCEKHNLHHSNMILVANKKQKNHKGYKCERI